MWPFLQGFTLGAGMIIPLGAQNSFVLSQGIKRNFHWLVAAICIICDIALINLGIQGGGQIIQQHPLALTIITWAGIVFLTTYGLLSFRAAMQIHKDKKAQAGRQLTCKVAIMTTLAVSLLNPHVFLDTVVILGSVGSQFAGSEKVSFTLGTMLASVVWFSLLAGLAASMATTLSQPKTRAVIDVIVGLILLSVAVGLFKQLY